MFRGVDRNMKKSIFFGLLIIVLLFIPQKSLAASENEITINKFSLSIRKDNNSPEEPLGNVKVNIYGVNSETAEQFLLSTTMSDSTGTVTMKKTSAPKKIDKVRFQYYFGNDDRGYLINKKNVKYNGNHSRDIPSNRIINVSRVGSISGVLLSAEFYSRITKLNNIYQNIYQNQKLAVEMAKPFINTSLVNFEPINIMYDDDFDLPGGFFTNSGYGEYIRGPLIGLNPTTVIDLKAGLTHEWAHWNMYRVNGMPGGSYKSHYEQVNPQVSYKEGWALFQKHRYTCGLSNKLLHDAQAQKDKELYDLYGYSTNCTVRNALYDIYDQDFPNDIESEHETFDIYSAFVNGTHSIKDKDLISEGIMYTLMVNSKASTFQEFYKYLMDNYIINHSDKTFKVKLENAVGINGINKDGSFKFGSSLKTLRGSDDVIELPDQISEVE